ncbi:acyl carrier protein [Epibacterium sp. Ofav1-8]|uniref:acyl carrier protein n=1 Tax=Epibacterium sp. Ofav1-8 TaxID=2917735 RepID=UPI001EF6ABEF|nr:acyl carrier protein [Epibacterium sp. Ofav1-8]MCG7622251.1 acyl carrier protein [Epibacterium sp. Ofav1-8]
MNKTISTAVSEVLSEVLERPVTGIRPDMRFDRDFDLDSYMFVQFLLGLEDKLPGLRFDPETIGQAGFNTMEKLVEHIEASLAQGEQAHA